MRSLRELWQAYVAWVEGWEPGRDAADGLPEPEGSGEPPRTPVPDTLPGVPVPDGPAGDPAAGEPGPAPAPPPATRRPSAGSGTGRPAPATPVRLPRRGRSSPVVTSWERDPAPGFTRRREF